MPVYLENFLHFAVGSPVPAGYYDRTANTWIAANDGRVVKMLSTTGGTATLDVDGKGTAATPASLAGLGITSDELKNLATLYTTGQTLWRVPISHFSLWDMNWAWGPPSAAWGPNGGQSGSPNEDHPGKPDGHNGPAQNPQDPSKCKGSQIGVESQTLAETFALNGTKYSLNYSSDRVLGRSDDFSVDIPLVGAKMPSDLKRVDLEIDVAGRKTKQSFSPITNQSTRFVWDGLDVYGRRLQGKQPIHVVIGYAFDGVYQSAGGGGSCASTPSAFGGSSFGHYSCGGSPATADPSRMQVSLEYHWDSTIGHWDAFPEGFGGFTISPHNAFDPIGQTLYYGDGSRKSATSLPLVITSFATPPAHPTAAITPGADGSIFFYQAPATSGGAGTINKVDPTGAISTLYSSSTLTGAGNSMFAAADGSLVFADYQSNVVRRLDTSGTTTIIAGTGTAGTVTDGTPATSAAIESPQLVAPQEDGSVLIAGYSGEATLFRVTPDGIIHTLLQAQTGQTSPPNDVPIGKTWLGSYLTALASGPNGSVYFAEGLRVRRIGSDGMVSLVAGGGDRNAPILDGVPATTAGVSPQNLAVRPDGTVLFWDFWYNALRAVGTNGLIWTITGNGPLALTTSAPPAAQVKIQGGTFGLRADGTIAIADSSAIRLIQPAISGDELKGWQVADDSGRTLYVFGPSGRHLLTIDTVTKSVLNQFTYDSAGRLASIIDVDGDITTIERDSSGVPTGIVAPFGQRTTLHANPDGFLDALTDANGNHVSLTYKGSNGLLDTLVDRHGGTHHFDFDADGRLVRDADPAGGSTTLTGSQGSGLTFTTTATTAKGLVSSHTIQLGDGTEAFAVKRQVTGPAGLTMTESTANDGTTTVTSPDGTKVTMTVTGDTRFGMDAPQVSSTTLTTPGGRSANVSIVRSATLSDAKDPLSVTSLTENWVLNGSSLWTKKLTTGSPLTQVYKTALGRTVTTTMDAHGRVVQVQVPGVAPVSTEYDAHGHMSKVTHGARSFEMSFDASGNPSSYTDPMGRMATSTFDPGGRLAGTTLADGRIVGYAYDTADNLTGVTPPGRPAHALAYTPVDLVASYSAPAAPPSLPSGSVTTWNYDADQNLQTIQRPDGKVVTYNYDTVSGRPSSLAYSLGALNVSYDSAGRVSSLVSPNGETLTYGYDGYLWTSTAWSGAVTGSVGISYDNNLRIVGQAVNGTSVAFGYDADGMLTSAGQLTINRDASNGRITGSTIGSTTEAIGYDPTYGDFASYSAAYGSTSLYSSTFTRNLLGHILTKNESIGGESHAVGYTYDTVGRLTDVTTDGVATAHYEYDSNGNRSKQVSSGGTRIPTYDAQDRLVTYGSDTFSYGAAGELFTRTSGSGQTTYTYDELGNMTGAALADGRSVSYLVDGANLRIGKKVNGTLVQGFLYQSVLKPVAELDASGNIVARFVYGTRGQVPDYIVKGGATYRVFPDHLGSPRLIVNVATGQIAQRLDYDEYGNVTQDTQPGFQPFGFAGGLYDVDTKLLHFGRREYDPSTGRSLTKDGRGFGAGQTNLYAYTFNDPVNYLDVDGNLPIIIPILAALFLIIGMGISAPSDTAEAPADILGMCLNVTGAPGMGSLGNFATWLGNDAESILQRLVDQAVADLSKNPALVAEESLLSEAEQQAVAACKGLEAPSFGKAVERKVANSIENDPYLRDLFEHVGDQWGAKGGPDFIGLGKFAGQTFEVTTYGQFAEHAARWYGSSTTFIGYDRPIYWLH